MGETAKNRRRSWPAVASAFAIVLLTIALGGKEALRYTDQLSALLALLLFVLLVACATTIRIRFLEQQAHRRQSQTEEDRRNFRELSQQLVKAREEERRSVSRELHDQIGQMLTGIQMQFTKIEVSQDPSEQSSHLTEGKALVNRTVQAVRDMAMGLRPSILDDLGLIPALEWQSREFSRQSGILVISNSMAI